MRLLVVFTLLALLALVAVEAKRHHKKGDGVTRVFNRKNQKKVEHTEEKREKRDAPVEEASEDKNEVVPKTKDIKITKEKKPFKKLTLPLEEGKEAVLSQRTSKSQRTRNPSESSLFPRKRARKPRTRSLLESSLFLKSSSPVPPSQPRRISSSPFVILRSTQRRSRSSVPRFEIECKTVGIFKFSGKTFDPKKFEALRAKFTKKSQQKVTASP